MREDIQTRVAKEQNAYWRKEERIENALVLR